MHERSLPPFLQDPNDPFSERIFRNSMQPADTDSCDTPTRKDGSRCAEVNIPSVHELILPPEFVPAGQTFQKKQTENRRPGDWRRAGVAYRELIKHFSRIRAYLRAFYVYGFRHRDEFTQKNARSYDHERCLVESWLGDVMLFRQDEDGRRVFLSIDSRTISANPLYRAFRTESFTDRNVTLYFHILDILSVADGLSVTGIMDALADRLSAFDDETLPDESTVRKKLKEYVYLGLLHMEKRGRETIYSRSEDHLDLSTWDATAAFFSEAAPLGVIGSFVQDRMPETFMPLRFKHHSILNALDSEILYELFCLISEQRLITCIVRRQPITALPLKAYIGTQTGRQYLLAWSLASGRFSFYRADLIDAVKAGDILRFPMS